MHMRIIYTADIHGYLFSTDYTGNNRGNMGLLELMQVFLPLKDENTLLLDGGDTLQGSPLAALAQKNAMHPHPCAALFNLAGFQYVALGNHDFDYGVEYLDAYLHELNAQCLCANIRDREGKLPVLSHIIHTLPNGIRVGICGVCTPRLMRWERNEVLSKLIIEDPVAKAGESLKYLKENSDLTVCIYHGGFHCDPESGMLLSADNENQGEEICALGYDILLSGHQHRTLSGREVSGTWAVQVANRGQ